MGRGRNLRQSGDDRRLYRRHLEDGDPKLLAAALGDVARSKGMSEIAKKTGVTREGLYKALSAEGDPRLTTFLGVIKSLGLRLSVKPAQEADTKSDAA